MAQASTQGQALKTGGRVRVRLRPSGPWRQGQVLLASDNGKSLSLVGEDLPSPPGGMTLHPTHGKVLVLLQADDGPFQELFTGALFDVELS